MKQGFGNTAAVVGVLVMALLAGGGCGGGHGSGVSEGEKVPSARVVSSLNLPANLALGRMALAPNGDLYVVTDDTTTALVKRFPNYGTGTSTAIGSTALPGYASYTTYLAFCAGPNQLYLVQNNHVAVLSLDGQSTRTFVLKNPSDTSGTGIYNVVADSRGYLYAARDYGVDKYDPNGNFVATLPASFSVYSSLVVDSADRLYLSMASHQVVRYAPDGTALPDLTLEDNGAPLAFPLFVGPSGDLYALDINSVVRHWDSTGKLVGSASFPSLPVAVDSQNRLYTADGKVYKPI